MLNEDSLDENEKTFQREGAKLIVSLLTAIMTGKYRIDSFSVTTDKPYLNSADGIYLGSKQETVHWTLNIIEKK